MSDVEDDANAFPKDGVTLRYVLEEFVPNCCGGEPALRGLTTADVCERYTKAPTFDLQCSYCCRLRQQGHLAVSKHATVFISHAHQYLFLDLLSALRHHFRNDLDVVIWLDLFSINQHITNDWSFEWLSQTFQTAIGDFGTVVMVMSPWNTPLPFTRAWCVFEAYCAAKTNAEFHIALSEQDRNLFLQDVMQDAEHNIDTMLASIRAEQSESFSPQDKESIFQVIRQEVGFAKLDSMVFECYRDWVVETTLQALQDTPLLGSRQHLDLLNAIGYLYQNQGDYEQAEKYFQESLDRRMQVLGVDDTDTLKAMRSLAELYARRGQLDKAETLFLNCIERLKELNGEDDKKSSLIAMMDLAWVYEQQGQWNQAESLFMECLEEQRATLGDNHQDTLISMNRLGWILSQKGQSKKAEKLLISCFNRQKVQLGSTHPDTLHTTNNLAMVYENQRQFEMAEPLYKACFDNTRVQLGDHHPNTLTYMNNLASFHVRQGNLDEAEVMHVECFKTRRSVLGADHPDTLSSMGHLAKLYYDQGRLDESKRLYLDCLEKQQAQLGDSHPQTLATMFQLGSIYYHQADLKKAKSMLRNCLVKQKQSFGMVHPKTLRTQQGLAAIEKALAKEKDIANSKEVDQGNQQDAWKKVVPK